MQKDIKLKMMSKIIGIKVRVKMEMEMVMELRFMGI